MQIPERIQRYSTPALVILAVVLINLAAVTLFFRLDLTRGGIYTLSPASRKAVSALTEPLTVKVFFTSNLPAPYNTIERYLHDLLAEYSLAGNRHFNYEFYDVSHEEDATTRKNRELALSYGISPVQVQIVEQDQVKFQKALMGMVLIHGNMVDTIPSITTTDGLEYKITSSIRKMVNKVSAFAGLKGKVEVRAYLSSSLAAVGPAMNVAGLADLPDKLEKTVEKLNSRYYGKLSFVHLDPTKDPSLAKEAERNHVLSLQWEAFRDLRGRTIPANNGYVGVIVRYQDRSEPINLLRVQRIPLFGTQYSLARPEDIEQGIAKTAENLIHVNEEIGVLADHGTVPFAAGYGGPGGSRGSEAAANLHKLLSEEYSVTPVNLKEGIPDSLPALIIAGPREPFSDYELYQIDQFLMKGKSLAIFLDAFNEITPQGRGGPFYQQQAPYYAPLRTGLERLLSHYGLAADRAYVLDKHCYKQKMSSLFGGGERPLFFAPIIENEMIAKNVPYLANIKGLIMLKASPVELSEKTLKDNDLSAVRLFSSSDRSWVLSDRVDMNSLLMPPPSDPGSFKSTALAYVVEGAFPSYFADKPAPAPPAQTGGKKQVRKKGTKHVAADEGTIRKGRPGKIFLIGTSEILKDNVIDDAGESPNAQFVLNVIDALNGRADNAIMRTKVQRFNPLRETKPAVRTAVKTANIAGLPALTVVMGFIVLFRRRSRKRTIQREFEKR